MNFHKKWNPLPFSVDVVEFEQCYNCKVTRYCLVYNSVVEFMLFVDKIALDRKNIDFVVEWCSGEIIIVVWMNYLFVDEIPY